MRLQGRSPPPQSHMGRSHAWTNRCLPRHYPHQTHNPPPSNCIRVTSWNARWLTDSGSDIVRAKRDLVNRRLLAGHIVCLQEAHWSPSEAAIWEQGLIVRNTKHACAVSAVEAHPWIGEGDTHTRTQGANERARHGGVSILLPAGYSFVEGETRELVPGHALQSIVRNSLGEIYDVVAVYLRPNYARAAWTAVREALTRWTPRGAALIIPGDFNTDLSEATGEGNNAIGDLLGFSWGSLGTVLASECSLDTETRQQRILDGALVRSSDAFRWTVSSRRTTLSDHPVLLFELSTGAQKKPATACTPSRFWSTPEAARRDLRANFEVISRAFGVPPIRREENARRPASAFSPIMSTPDETGLEDPVWALADTGGEEDRNNMMPPSEENMESAEWKPLLASWGRIFIHAAFSTWWRKWRAMTNGLQPERDLLVRIIQGSGTLSVQNTPLGAWLNSMKGPNILAPTEARHWLVVWDRAALRASAGTVRGAGPTTARPALHRTHQAGKAVMQAKGQRTQFTRGDGSFFDSPAEAGRALLATRQKIWFEAPAKQLPSGTLLTAYTASRRHNIPQSPPLRVAPLRTQVLIPYDSMPGDDGMPYEALHLHPQLIAWLLAQGLMATEELREGEDEMVKEDPELPLHLRNP